MFKALAIASRFLQGDYSFDFVDLLEALPEVIIEGAIIAWYFYFIR